MQCIYITWAGVYRHTCVNTYTAHVIISYLFHAGIDMSRGQSFGCFGKTQVQRKYNTDDPFPMILKLVAIAMVSLGLKKWFQVRAHNVARTETMVIPPAEKDAHKTTTGLATLGPLPPDRHQQISSHRKHMHSHWQVLTEKLRTFKFMVSRFEGTQLYGLFSCPIVKCHYGYPQLQPCTVESH